MKAPCLADIVAANAHLKDGRYALISMSRPLGPYLAWAAIRVGLTPRQVNYFSLVLAVYILWMVALGSTNSRILGTALVFVWQIIDVTDGTMARALKIRDNFGGFVDYATGMIVAAFLPLSLGIGVSLTPDGSLNRLAAMIGVEVANPAVVVLVAAALISTMSLYMRLISRVLVIRFGDSIVGLKASRDADERPGRFQSFARNLETLGGLQAVVFFLGAVLGQLEVLLVGYTLFYCVTLALFAISIHRGYSKRTRSLSD